MQAAVNAAASPRTGLRFIRSIAALALIGTAISLVSLYHHFSRAKTSFCDIGVSFNCDMVNRSAYSVVAGVPVALIGAVGYLLIFGLATLYREKPETPTLLLISSCAGLTFAGYLTYIEARVLFVWCILCLSSLGTITAICAASAALLVSSRRQS